MALQDIVNVIITRVTTTVSRIGFGTPLITGFHTVFAERAKVFSSVADIAAEGFADASPTSGVIADPILTAARAIFSQDPSPNRVVIGRNANKPAHSETLTIASVVADTAYSVVVNGNTATFTSDATPLASEISTGLTAAIDALPGGANDQFDAVDGAGTIALTAGTNAAAGVFELTVVDRALITRKNDSSDPGVGADLTAIQVANNDFFAVVPTSQSEAEINALATSVEAITTPKRLLLVASADDDILTNTSGNIADDLNPGQTRTALMYHSKPHTSPNGAWGGKLLPKDPGSVTWAFKTLAGIDPDTLTTGEITNIEVNKANHYTAVAGVAITQQGTVSSGEFIDIQRFISFIETRLQENVFARLAAVDKIPFTDPGIAIIEAEVRAVLQLGIAQGGFAASPEPTVTVPRAADVSLIDKANRTLPDIKFTATLAGAIHAVTINGVVSV